jgi:hypothetical protein
VRWCIWLHRHILLLVDPSENPLLAHYGLSQIGSDQMHVKGENPLMPRCKFSALTNSQRHHGALLDAGLATLSVPEINELV